MATNYNNLPEATKKILVLFAESKKKKINETSANNYANSVPNAFKSCKFLSESERDFLTLLPKLLKAQNREQDIQKLIVLVRRSVFLHNWGISKKSYKTYILHFLNYIENNINIVSKEINGINDDEDLKLKSTDDDKLKEDFKKSVEFSHNALLKKFKSRLRSQERTSGEKIWLPLDYIAKIYRRNNKKKNTGFSEWLDNLVNGIYIHYKDGNQIKYTQVNKNISLDFSKNEGNEDYYDVWVIFNQNDKKYRVYTPTGIGNEKVPMTVKNISEIDIDHVKPIDLTLRQLGDENNMKIGTLYMVSKSYKEVVKSGKDVNTAIGDLFKDNNFNISSLTNDLEKIKNDTALRLMDSKYNENKSNGFIYEKFIEKDDDKSIIGILGHIDEDDNNNPLTIYKILNDKDCKIKATSKKEKIEGKGIREIKDFSKIIDFI